MISLGRARNISIIFPTQLVNGLDAPEIYGKLSTESALEALLAETNIAYRKLNPRVIRLHTRDQKTNIEPDEHYYDFIEEISVIGQQITGSRLHRHDLEGSAPVDIISAPRIAELGSQSVGELLKFLPAVSGNSTSTSIGNGGDGTATVTLRGLPASNTLVLVNGHRIANSGFAGEAVDLNSISPDTIERIEILKSGSSAIYGSDAIAGVININLKSNFNGLSVNQYLGQSDRGDLSTSTTNISFGKDFEGGNFMVSASRFRQDPIFSRDRELSASADGRPFGGSDSRSSATPNGRYILSDGRSLTQADEPGEYRPTTEEDRYNFGLQTSAVSKSQRDALYFSANTQLSSNLRLSGDLAFGQTDAVATLASTPVFTAFNPIPLTVSKDNIYNPFGEDIDDVRYRALEAGPRLQEDQSKSYRANLDIDGEHQELSWTLNWNWSRTESNETLFGIFDAYRVQRALGPGEECQGAAIDNCVPLNLFGPNISQEQLDYISTTSPASGFTELSELSATVKQNLYSNSAGTAQILAGVSYRNEEANFSSQSPPGEQIFIGGSAIGDTDGKRDVREAFFEAFIPLLANKHFVQSLDLEIAARHSDYSDFGKNTSPKVGLRFRPVHDLLIRASYAEGFRAPSLQELHKGETQTFLTLHDPCDDPSNTGTLIGCTQQSDPSLNQFLTLRSGNDSLKAELADTSSIGLVWTPDAISNLHLSLDYFDISQRNVVGASAQFIINQNAIFGEFQDLIHRDSNGNIQQISAPNLNIGRRNIGGLDLQMNYKLAIKQHSRVELSLNASHIYRYRYQVSPNQEELNLAGTFSDEAAEGNGALPKWKISTGIKYKRRNWQLHYNIHYVSPLQEITMSNRDRRQASSWVNQNLQFNYAFNQKTRLSLGVDNLFDKSPPYLDSAFLDNHDARTYDLKGRYWYTRINYKFM